MARPMRDSTKLIRQFDDGVETTLDRASLGIAERWEQLLRILGLDQWRARKPRFRPVQRPASWLEPGWQALFDSLAEEGVKPGKFQPLKVKGEGSMALQARWQSATGGRVPVAIYTRSLWEGLPNDHRKLVRAYIEQHYGTVHLVLYPDQALVQFEIDTVKIEPAPAA